MGRPAPAAAAASVLLLFLYAAAARALTVQEVAHELECPCDCPLVLEDCNMSCGLDWKDEIGEAIKAGKTKDEIIRDFMDRYGEACRITPMRRIRGKIYQYTRGFDTMDWVVLWGGAALWTAALFAGVALLVRRFSKKKEGSKEGSD
ncbi:MAG TPA: hypothetical protein ENJ37_08595 [Deltaproteobacteria bacterium]|nr:hypothetical protein [Deltaproteobacteria bacterium]